MKLVIAVISDEDAKETVQALLDSGFKCTKLASTGGFLKAGNTTLMIGVLDKDLEAVYEILKENCRTREEKVSAGLMDIGGLNFMGTPTMDITVGGAVIFVVNVVDHRNY